MLTAARRQEEGTELRCVCCPQDGPQEPLISLLAEESEAQPDGPAPVCSGAARSTEGEKLTRALLPAGQGGPETGVGVSSGSASRASLRPYPQQLHPEGLC